MCVPTQPTLGAASRARRASHGRRCSGSVHATRHGRARVAAAAAAAARPLGPAGGRDAALRGRARAAAGRALALAGRGRARGDHRGPRAVRALRRGAPFNTRDAASAARPGQPARGAARGAQRDLQPGLLIPYVGVRYASDAEHAGDKRYLLGGPAGRTLRDAHPALPQLAGFRCAAAYANEVYEPRAQRYNAAYFWLGRWSDRACADNLPPYELFDRDGCCVALTAAVRAGDEIFVWYGDLYPRDYPSVPDAPPHLADAAAALAADALLRAAAGGGVRLPHSARLATGVLAAFPRHLRDDAAGAGGAAAARAILSLDWARVDVVGRAGVGWRAACVVGRGAGGELHLLLADAAAEGDLTPAVERERAARSLPAGLFAPPPPRRFARSPDLVGLPVRKVFLIDGAARAFAGVVVARAPPRRWRVRYEDDDLEEVTRDEALLLNADFLNAERQRRAGAPRRAPTPTCGGVVCAWRNMCVAGGAPTDVHRARATGVGELVGLALAGPACPAGAVADGAVAARVGPHWLVRFGGGAGEWVERGDVLRMHAEHRRRLFM